MISIKNLSFSFFNSDRKALDNVSLDIPEGPFVAITGPSGCGKSTLALAMGGYIPHVFEGLMEGEVVVDGKRTSYTELSELAQSVCIVQQDPESQLCTLSVMDEVSFGPENLGLSVDEVLCRVDESLSMVGASYLKNRQVYELSGGEKQRVAVASMLAMRPKALILDEPTSNLDPTGASAVLAAVERLKEMSGMAIIVIEHKLDRLMGLTDRLVVMDKGRIVIDGKPSEVLEKYRDRIGAMGVRLPGGACPALAANGGFKEHPPAIDVAGLQASYEGKEVLHGVDFKAYPSEIVGIIGPNGSGKTTFLNVLMGLRGHKGKVVVLSRDVAISKASDLAKRSGFVFQNPNHQIFERTVYDEAAFALRNFRSDEGHTRAAVQPALVKYGLAAYASKHPLGISFGEKRRLNLCSILPHGPSVILMDEPFVGQDYANVTRMCEELLHLKEEGKAILLVSHDIDMVYRYCDRVALFKDGRVLVDSSPREAMGRIKELGMLDYVPEGCRDED